ncbi:hybrid sensor histidine kinase/response regulator [Psychroflexus montanilacus]|uniref:hybrid sensor histidine kinase/response regulator n=1 Tax=Psychroflexus montanilacus TaxID=2873598 RepID=UPI001CCC8BDD|nr:ATP-binding protein [Psychroflexus montanilacus]MBZ9650437.1 response regulator [Psychroflexus montanilacus]
MFKLKGKMMWLFALFSVSLLAIGFYFYDSLNALGNKVENTLTPNKRSDHLKKIMVDLNKLNNLYLVDSERFNSMKSDSLILSIEMNVDSVKSNFNQDRILENRNLDTIPSLLRQIRDDYFELENRREQSQEVFVEDLKLLVNKELSKIEAKPSDSVTIIKQINSEIYEKIEENAQEEDERSFFQRLFGASKPEPDTTETRVSSTRDTLIKQSIDTLFTKSDTPTEKASIFPAIQDYQQKRINVLNALKSQEQEIFRKNIEVNNYVENTLNEILFEEYEYYNKSIKGLKEDYITYFFELGVIIAVLILVSLISLFIILNDINKNIYYQQKLKASEAKAKRNALEKQKFLSTMSHELRTPLTSIIGYSDLLDDKDENVKSIKVASNYLYQMTNEILDMAKIQAGIIEIHNVPCNLSKVFRDIEQGFKELVKNQKLDPIFKIPVVDLYVKTDAQRLQQILYNLMHNALKYTEEGYIKLNVNTEVINDKIDVTIEVEDSGIGMTDEEIKSVFKDYQQAGTHKNKMKGTGLGLGIVKKLVKEMGGKLSVESEPNQGSIFKINFEFDLAQKEAIAPEIKKFDFPVNALKDKRIFILDDDVLISRLYVKLFEPYGPQLKVFNDANKGLEHLMDNHAYDLYILDFKMPFMTGYELIMKLRENGIYLKNTIVSTANVMLNEEEKQKLKIFDEQAFKPIKRDIILEKAAKLLNIQGQFNSKSVSEQQNSESFNFKDLRVYAGDDEDILNDLVQTLVSENDKELSNFKIALIGKNTNSLAEIIHKLSSRFAQVNAKPIHDPKALELSLRDDSLEMDVSALEDLYLFWKKVNEEMKTYLEKVS